MNLTHPAISRRRKMLVEVPITGHDGQRDIAPVSDPHLAIDENLQTRARLDSASWQSIRFLFDSVRVAKVRVKSNTYEGSKPLLNCGGVEFIPDSQDQVEWFEIDRDASSLSIGDATGGRTWLYELSVFILT